LEKEVGSFSKGGGVLIGQSILFQKGEFSINSFASTSRITKERKKENAVAHPDSVRIGFSVLRIECPIAPGTQ